MSIGIQAHLCCCGSSALQMHEQQLAIKQSNAQEPLSPGMRRRLHKVEIVCRDVRVCVHPGIKSEKW